MIYTNWDIFNFVLNILFMSFVLFDSWSIYKKVPRNLKLSFVCIVLALSIYLVTDITSFILKSV